MPRIRTAITARPPIIPPMMVLGLGLGSFEVDVGEVGGAGWEDGLLGVCGGGEVGCGVREGLVVDEDGDGVDKDEDGVGEDADGIGEDEVGVGEDEENIDVVDVEDGVIELGVRVKEATADEVVVGSANKKSVPAAGAQAIYEYV